MDLVTLLALATVGLGSPGAAVHEHRIAAVTLAAADPIDRWEPLIAEASRRFGVQPAWICTVMRAESAGRTTLKGRPITSSAGAMGLMQVMPETYREMSRSLGLDGDPYDPRDNILAGTAFLRAMYDRFGYPGLFAAYHAGPERFDAWLRHGTPLPAETLGYLRRIGSGIAETVLAMGTVTGSDSMRSAGSGAQITFEFRSGRALFFVLGSAKNTAPIPPFHGDENVNPAPVRGAIFVTPGHESASPTTPSGNILFVPLSRRPQ